MALTRKALSAMGIEAEKIDQIIEMHSESINGLKEEAAGLKDEVSKYKADAEKLPKVTQELADLKKQVADDAKAREGKDYDKLKKEYDDFKADVAKKAVRENKEKAYKDILKDAGIPERHFAKILKYSDVDGVELDENDQIKTKAEILKQVKEEWHDHIEQKEKKGADTPNPPANNGGETKKTKADIIKIKDTNERQKAIAENPELFGISVE